MKEKILLAKKENPEFGSKRIAKMLGCSSSTVRYHLDDRVKTNSIARKANRRSSLISKLKAEHGGKCTQCGYCKCLEALHFHHSDPSKKLGSVSLLIFSNGNNQLAISEVKKCVLLCANCHVESHYLDH